MQKHRIVSLASILAMLLIPVLGWVLVAQPQLAAASIADQQRADTEVQIAESAAIVAQLKADSAKLPELNDDLNSLRTSIPYGVDNPGYIDGLDALAKLAKVDIVTLTMGEAEAYAPAVAPVDPNAVAPDAAAQGEDAATDGTAPPVAADPAIVTSPLINAQTFVAIPVTVEAEGGWSQILKFVQGLQTSPRLFLVTGLSTKTLDDGRLKGVIAGYIYAIPTGVEGKPRPISTTVKQLEAEAPETEVPEGETPDPGSTTQPTPGPTETPAP